VATHSRILVVDDDTELRRSLAEVLTEAGYDVSCARNGEEALRALADEREPNAILLDLAMPVMDGWTFRSLQRSDPRLAHIPTVIITASLSADPAQVERLAPDAFLAKPFSLERLIETLRRLAAPADGDHVHAL
jgi:CheY-like chemotaxis protein